VPNLFLAKCCAIPAGCFNPWIKGVSNDGYDCNPPKGDRVTPSWCNDDYEKTPGLCALCGRICIIGRGIGPRPEIVPTACDRRQEATLRLRID
jgi:hypothetical protein